jgi:hypothetical protein
MPFQDLVQALPGVLIAALFPGFGLATILGPQWHWWARLAMAPGLSAGFIGVVGLAMHDVHIPFELLSVLPLFAILGIGAVIRWRRADRTRAVPSPWWLPVPALITGVVGASVFAWALRGQVLPPDWDSATHGGLATAIARAHDVLPLIPIPIEGTAFARARPGFEAMSAVVSWLGGPSPASSMGPIVAATILLLPLSLTLLALEATGSIVLAAVVPFFALGLAFPSDQAIVGRFPEMVDSTLVVPFIVVTVRIMRGVFTRDNALLLFAITASVWVIHGLEVFTAIVIACALLLATAVRMVRASPRLALLRTGAAAGAVLAGAVLVTLLTRMPHVPPPVASEPSAVVLPTASTPIHFHYLLVAIAQTDLISPVTVALYIVGVIALLIQRRMLWVLAAQVVLLVLMLDDFFLHKFERLWRLVYPWGDPDRIVGVQYWLIPLVLGAGFLALLRVMRYLSRTRQLQLRVSIGAVVVAVVLVLARHPLGQLWTQLIGRYPYYTYPLGMTDPLAQLRPWILAIAITVLAVIIAWIALARGLVAPRFVRRWLGSAGERLDAAGLVLAAVAMVCLVVGAASELDVYNHEVATRSIVSPADVAVLQRMSEVLPKSTIVMSDGGDDAGMWMAALSTLTPQVPNGFAWNTLDTPLDIDLQNACTDPARAEAALENVDALFIGALEITAPFYPWKLSCIARLPNLRLIASARWNGKVAAGFTVIK